MGVTQVKDSNSSQKPWLMYILTFFAQWSLIYEGYGAGASSGAVLLAQDYLQLNIIWKQLIIAGTMPSSTISCLIGAYFSDTFGRRTTMMFACFCHITGSIVSCLAPNRVSLLMGRLVNGCGIGFADASTSVYIAECAPRHIRGRLLGLNEPLFNIGMLIGTFIAVLFSNDKDGWRYVWGIQGILGCIQFFALNFLPDSPYWLIQKSRKKEAEASLARIRNAKNVEEEMQEIEASLKENSDVDKFVFWRMLKTRSVRQALLVGCGLHLISQFSGADTVAYYITIIIQMSGVGNVTSALWNSVIVICISLIFAIVGVWLVDSVGRRKLAIIGLFGLFVSSLCLGTTFHMAAIYSPFVNATDDFSNITCSTHGQCDDCIRDAACGFCYEETRDVMTGDCLPVSDTSQLISEVGACNSSLAFSKYSTIWAYDYCPISFSWIAIIALALSVMFNAASVSPLPWTVNAEIYPLWARSTGNGVGSMLSSLCNLIIVVSFLSFVELIRAYGVFYVIASVSLIGTFFCFFFLPETKNKSLGEIEELFTQKKATV